MALALCSGAMREWKLPQLVIGLFTFSLTIAGLSVFQASPDWLAILALCAAVWIMVASLKPATAWAVCGALTGFATMTFTGNGAPLIYSAALSLGALVIGLALLGWRQGGFKAKASLLLPLTIAGLLLSIGVGVLEGFQSAEALNRGVETVTNPVPVWAICLLLLAFVGGLARELWKSK